MSDERRYLLDGTMARRGGGFTYLVNVVPALARLAPQHRFLLLARNSRLTAALPALPNLEVELLPEAGLRERFRFTYLEAARRAADWRADLYFSAGESVPLHARCPVIASFRNACVLEGIGEWAPWQRPRLWMLQAIARVSARRADRVLFVSRDSARRMGDAIGLADSKRAWLHHGIDTAAWSTARSEPSVEPFILSVSSIYRYKNYIRLIQAYADLLERHPDAPDLVIVGDVADPPHARLLEAARLASGPAAERIHLVGEVPYPGVRDYYERAALFVFPSYRETFGFPLLEAMAAELPIVASDLPVFREIAGDAAFYADPFEPKAIAAAMEQALYSPGAAATLVKRGRARVREFTWRRTAERLLALFDDVLDERAQRASASVAGPVAARPR